MKEVNELIEESHYLVWKDSNYIRTYIHFPRKGETVNEGP